MPEAATLTHPTNRDEDWRYSDGAWLASAEPERVHAWRTLTVGAGETVRELVGSEGDALDRLRVHVGAGGRFEAFGVLDTGDYRRVEVEVTLEDGAHFEFGGVTIGGGTSTREFVTRTIHAEPNATSNQIVRAVQWGKSTGNFLGRIEVVRDAQKTDAAQNFRAILLEKGATANTKPELEIFADDVLCAHGAAIGQLDEMAAYYMASRGLPPAVARKLLVQAFIGDAFVECSDDDVRERMMEQALAKLDEATL
ncbi:SufD family Fe-S cluster assembly protein [Aurantiacibacter sp. D1-12]|uniref:SufD family Fe-S cluster assembly protein n=1 Tax=Aurantiacibacter sp. D1-12 TaxID=2993658 RepID=UPI00237CCD57|nr:SufD family Fe-S cluster assembly protein [Aurantiacibacter sp. D1-12]MDE1468082.1 SufD family Fe-S cluster assembly protein [Aurantiacibacter sp. D1-12]